MLRRNSQVLQCWSLSLTALFSLSLGLAAHHRATAQHGYCSDHGQQIHLEHADQRTVTDDDRGKVRHEHHVGGAHDCALLSFLAQTSTVAPRGCWTGVRQQLVQTTLTLPAAPLAAIPLLRISPKNSPPA